VWVEITVTSSGGRELYAAAVRHVLKPRIRAGRRFGVALAIVGIGAIVWFFVGPHSFGLLLFGVTLATLAYYYVLSYGRSALRASVNNLGRQHLRTRTLTLTDDYLIIEGPYEQSRISWYAFRCAEELPGMLLLTSGRSMLWPVPLAGLDPEQLQQVRSFVAGRDWSADRPGQTPLERPTEMPWTSG
jgi:hypothetical protein